MVTDSTKKMIRDIIIGAALLAFFVAIAMKDGVHYADVKDWSLLGVFWKVIGFFREFFRGGPSAAQASVKNRVFRPLPGGAYRTATLSPIPRKQARLLERKF